MRDVAKPRSSPNGDGKAVSGAKEKPSDCLTTAESKRKFVILDGIDAIPVKLMPSSLKPLTRQMVGAAGSGSTGL